MYTDFNKCTDTLDAFQTVLATYVRHALHGRIIKYSVLVCFSDHTCMCTLHI